MKGLIGKGAWRLIVFVLFAVALGGAELSRAAAVGLKTDYAKLPAFLETGLNPNLLLLIDNSASMYDPAYGAVSGSACYADDFDATTVYAGYFDSAATSWYKYDGFKFVAQSAAEAATTCADAPGGDKYTSSDVLCLTINGAEVTAFAARGSYLNWLATSRFDVEKEILTGGKYNAGLLVMESRGCLESRFVKQTPVLKGGVAYYATFGIRPPDVSEQGDDDAYFGADVVFSNTRIEIYQPTIGGFDMTKCDLAIAEWAKEDAHLGTLKGLTEDCLAGAGGGSLTASHTAFNHIIQECWYYKSKGYFQPGAGTVNSLKNDCDAVYGTLAGDYTAPEDLHASDVCAGQYAPSASNRWGYGYVGQCWEATYGAELIEDPCDAGDFPQSTVTSVDDGLGNYYYCDVPNLVYKQCNKKPNPSNGACSPGGWVTRMVPDPAASTIPTAVNWTDDDSDLCVDTALKSYCQNLDDVTVVDPDVSDPEGTAWAVPAVLVNSAVESQLGQPLWTLKGRVAQGGSAPLGLVQEFKYNLRLGAMEFNRGALAECEPVQRGDLTYKASLYDCLVDKDSYISISSVADSSQRDGGRIISYIDDEDDGHNDELVAALNAIEASAWTPTAEALYNAVGYYTQDNTKNLRLNYDDFIWDHDVAALKDDGTPMFPAWNNSVTYAAGDKIQYTHNWDHDGDGFTDETETKLYFTRNGGTSAAGGSFEEDTGMNWTPYDPVLAGCQTNNILIISDGASTADMNPTMTNFAALYGDLLDSSADGECLTTGGDSSLYGSTRLDDMTYYASQSDNTTLYQGTYQTVDTLAKQPITTYVVAAGTLENDAATECNAKTQLTNAAVNSGTILYEPTNPEELKTKLREVFDAIGGEVSSGSAASVISHSRSGDGAIYQAIFYPKQVVGAEEVVWTGDVHALWLDADGNIREDCGDDACSGPGDKIFDESQDHVIEFYTDDNGSAKARKLSEPGGTSLEDNILLKDLHYLWSAADWLADAAADTQRSYNSDAKSRYIFTMLPDASGHATPIVPFTKTDLAAALTPEQYSGYFNAGTDANGTDRTADGIVDYIRGVDQIGYRSRSIDWTDSPGSETVKLGDIIHSTPTLVGHPAENYDVIYGDPTYQVFRKTYQNRRAVVYAGGNDGGLHAFNGGFYDQQNSQFLPAPDDSLVQYDLGAELWMYVPKNVFPHLRWLTETDYGDAHNYYVDGKPYIFDAKIFTPDSIHPGGWGTVLVVGMRYGGGNIQVDTDGDTIGDETMRSSYSILDVTNPELPPVVLAEFNHPDLGYTTGSPTAIPMLRCDKNTLAGKAACDAASPYSWPMDWYLALGSGPHSNQAAPAGPAAGMQGLSDQGAGVYLLKLGGVGWAVDPGPASLDNIGSGQVASGNPTFTNPPALVGGDPVFSGSCSDPTFNDKVSCVNHAEIWTSAYCSNLLYENEADCIAAPEIWTPGFCSNASYSTEASCEAAYEIWTPEFCSNPAYTEQVSCEAAPEAWTWTDGTCSNPAYNGDQTGCLAASATWTGTVGECSDLTSPDQTSCEAAFANWTWTVGVCSNPSFSDEASCIAATEIWTTDICVLWGLSEDQCIAGENWMPGSCSDPAYSDEASCTASTGVWTEMSCRNPTVTEATCDGWSYLGAVWLATFCSDPAYSDEASCIAASATWIWTDGTCSNPAYNGDQAGCLAAPEAWTWTDGTCSNPAYNGDQAGCLAAPEAWTWTDGECSDLASPDQTSCEAANATWTSGVCSNASYSDAASCEAAPEIWTPGVCSNDAYVTEASCITAYEIWTPGVCSDGAYLTELACITPPHETWTTTSLDNSFFGDFIAVDYDLSFQTDTLYFGSVYNASSGIHSTHKGAMHRLVINDNPDPATWNPNIFYDVESPVTAAPSVATDGTRAWVYFGTGRLYSAKEDKAILATTPATQFLGLKENYDSNGEMDLYSPNRNVLIDVTDTEVMEGGALAGSPIFGVGTFSGLDGEMSALSGGLDLYTGWKIELADGERVIGQPAILGDIVTFTSFIPSNDPCEPDGDSYLWAPYFRTGTAYYLSVVGQTDDEILRKVGLGKGLSTTPNIHTGSGDGSTAFVQSSTGAILSIEQTNPGVVKSGMQSWRELGGSCTNNCN